jgi:hypothetical protein
MHVQLHGAFSGGGTGSVIAATRGVDSTRTSCGVKTLIRARTIG